MADHDSTGQGARASSAILAEKPTRDRAGVPDSTSQPDLNSSPDTSQMRAMTVDQYGGPDCLRSTVVSRPRVGDDELLIRVKAAGVNPIDWRLRKGSLRVINPARFPLILGFDVAGTVVATGSKVADRWSTGDEVFAFLDDRHGGGYAEFAKVKASVVARKPERLSFEEAAGVPLAAITALQSLRDHGKLASGKRVLINGASGGVGTFAVQIAKCLDAHVTAVCSGKNEQLVRDLGADDVIDYTSENFLNSTRKYDLLFDAVGKASYWDSRKILRRDGRFVTTLPSFESSASQLVSYFHGPQCKNMLAKPSRSDMEQLRRWLEEERIRVIVSELFPMEDVSEAHALSEEGHVRGKIVLRGFV